MNSTERTILQSPHACAQALVAVVIRVYGSGVFAWEPDTLRLELIEDGVVAPQQNLDAIFAAITLYVSGDVYWDAEAFAQTVRAFNRLPILPDRLPKCDISSICWAVTQMLRLDAYPDEMSPAEIFDQEVDAYIACVAYEMGLAVLPDVVSFAQYALDDMIPQAKKLQAQVRESLPHVSPQTPLGETAADIQLAHLIAVGEYVKEHDALCAIQLRALGA